MPAATRVFAPSAAAAMTALLAAAAARPAAAQPVAQPYATGLNQPIFLAQPTGGGDARRFIVERGGTVRVVSPGGVLQAGNYLDISSSVTTGGEGGLLGLAFTPNFSTSGVLYVHYTAPNSLNDGLGGEGGGADSPFDTVVERITLNGPSSASPTIASRQTVLRFAQPYDNHNGGWIGFRRSDAEGRYLYVPTGDGGSGNDPGNRAQNLGSVFGKLLRLDVAGGGTAPSGTIPGVSVRNYGIPADNYFAADGNAATLGEVTAYGFRNPFRDSFDRATGTLYIGDVGQGAREEVDTFTDGQADRNYGWRLREGRIQTPGGGVGGPTPPDNVEPIFDYAHGGDPVVNGNSLTGGIVYRGSLLGPAYQGLYFFADYGANHLFTINPFAADPETTPVDVTGTLFPGGFSGSGIVAINEDEAGEVYVVDIGGTVYQVVPEPAGVAVFAAAALGLRRRRDVVAAAGR